MFENFSNHKFLNRIYIQHSFKYLQMIRAKYFTIVNEKACATAVKLISGMISLR